jgi:hypothetical protein
MSIFGDEHNKLQASVLSVKTNENVVRLQSKKSAVKKAGFFTTTSSDFEGWKKDDAEFVERMWDIIETVTPEDGEKFLIEFGFDIDEIKNKNGLLI